MTRYCLAAVLGLAGLGSVTPTLAGDSHTAPAREREGWLVGSAAVRRDAGRQRRLLPWLQISTLLEVESLRSWDRAVGGRSASRGQGPNVVVQLDWEADLQPWLKLEGGNEYDFEAGRHLLDELSVVVEFDAVEIAVGKQYFPFGEYYSHFISGPVLEFAETRDTGVLLSLKSGENAEWSVFGFDGRVRNRDGGNRRDWGAAFVWRGDILAAGASYLSDLAESDAEFLRDVGSRYRRRVPAVAAQAEWSIGASAFTVEYIGALADFAELEADRNRPAAWNVEFAQDILADWQWAIRYEGSREIEDEPRERWGFAVNWRAWDASTVSLEYLRGRYQRGLADDSRGSDLKTRRELNLRLSLPF